jgi:hypothetical protein
MKQQFSLSDSEFAELNELFNAKDGDNVHRRWSEIGQTKRFNPETVEPVPQSNDARLFLAEPLPPLPAPATQSRGEWTSASNAQSDLLCPGRHLAQRGIPDDESEDAASGRRIHSALAGGAPIIDRLLSLEERETFDMCREDEKKLAEAFFGDQAGKPMKVYREERRWVQFDGNGQRLAHSGQADLVFRQGTKALVIDYKVLRGDVAEAPENQQLRDLAVLNWRNLELVSEVGTAIVQPWVTRSPKICLYTQPDLDRAEKEMLERVMRSNLTEAKRVPGPVQCKFCKAKNKCAEHNQWVGSQLPIIAEPVLQAGLFQVAMDKWSPEQRSLAASILPTVTKRLEEMKDWLKTGLAGDPHFIPGYQLKPGSIRESVKDVQALFDRFTALGGKLDQFFPCITVQKGELKRAVAEVSGTKGKALDGTMKQLLDGITESKQSAPTLERMGD